MGRNRPERILIEFSEREAGNLGDRISGFHRDIIRRRVEQWDMPDEQRAAAVGMIIKKIKDKEQDTP